MQAEQNILNRFTYTAGEWQLVKILTGILWFMVIVRVAIVNGYRGQPFPEGICKLFNCSVFTQPPLAYVVVAISAVLVVLYIGEKFMLPVLISIAIISVVVFSVERSNGLKSRDELWSMVFIAQAIAYLRHALANTQFRQQHSVRNVAMFYSVQLIAAAYVIAGIAKLQVSGLNWIADSPNIVLATTKVFQQMEIEFHIAAGNTYYNTVIYFAGHYPHVIRLLFAGALLIELCAFMAMFSRGYARKYGFALLALHAGIAALTAIVIPVFVFCVITYLVGWPKFITRLFQRGAQL